MNSPTFHFLLLFLVSSLLLISPTAAFSKIARKQTNSLRRARVVAIAGWGDPESWRFDGRDGRAFEASVLLAGSLNDVQRRKAFLESIVTDGRTVLWDDIILAIALSCRDGGPEWTFNLFEPFMELLRLGNDFDTENGSQVFSELMEGIVGTIATDEDTLAFRLMGARVREQKEDALYEQGLDEEQIAKALSFGNMMKGISPENDRRRREVAFATLCLLRFVRLGVSP